MNTKKLKIGLLPFWIELYDEVAPDAAMKAFDFAKEIADIFNKKGIDVITGSICRLSAEFMVNIYRFEQEGADAIITLHLAYSPSLESIDPLLSTRLPIIVLDTTPAFDFSGRQSPDEIMGNHGIHGVQDMCSMLKRNQKPFLIQAGHYIKSDVIDRVISDIRSAKMAVNMKTARVGRVGKAFKGMGDFSVSDETLTDTLGPVVVPFNFSQSEMISQTITEDMIRQEMQKDQETFDVRIKNTDLHYKAVHAGLMLRHFIDSNRLTAVTVNFLDIDKASGFCSMPFLEISKAMAGGTGYAGEGDTLTAAFTGAIMQAGYEASFTEMFCPDWEHDSVFLSHMGEMNLQLAASKPVLSDKPFIFSDTGDTVFAWSCFKEGRAVFANLAPSAGSCYTLILSEGNMIDPGAFDNMKDTVHGWFSPDMPLPEFLEKFSLAGGTHHSAIIYGSVLKELKNFGILMGWDVKII